LSAERLEGALEFFLEILEHRLRGYFSSRDGWGVVGRLSLVVRGSSFAKASVSS
jgi:hypothetical protein